MSRSIKKDYPKKFDSRRFDWSCRCHGSCSYCRRNRLHFDSKARVRANTEEQIDEYIDLVIGAGDPTDALMAHDDVLLVKHGIDPWDFATRNELNV
jgi:hypothetical protein